MAWEKFKLTKHGPIIRGRNTKYRRPKLVMHARIETKQTPCKTSAFEEGEAVVSKVILQSIALLGADKKRWLSRHYGYRGANHITVRKTHNCAKNICYAVD